MLKLRSQRKQQGVMLLEALIAILIFSIGILALVAMQGLAIGYTADAKYRSDASFLANQIVSQIWLDRGAVTDLPGRYAYPGGTATELTSWITRVNSSLPSAAPTITIVVAASGTPPINIATVTVNIGWTPPNASSPHTYSTVSWVQNPQ